MKKRWILPALMGFILCLTGFTLLNSPRSEAAHIEDNEDRVKWLESVGRSVEPTPLTSRYVTIPETLPPVLEVYNKLQLAQGFDLRKYCGKTLEQYSYKATQTYNGETLYYSIYVYNGRIVAADAHTASLNGAMMGLLRTEEQ